MVMSVVWAVLLGGSIICALVTGRGQMLSAGVMQGAQSGVTLAISIAGSLCLWAGVGRLMEKIGFTAALARLLRPVTGRLFPSTMVMDNIFYYGECEIIGNLPLQPEDEDYPIHYGQSISIGDSSLCYQRGKTFLTLPNEKELFPGFRNGQIGWQLNVCLPILLECIQADSNLPYWNQTRDFIIREDLRNPKYRALLEQVQAQFHIT